MRMLLPALLVLTVLCSATSHADTVRLTSLEWPPYSGATLAGQGSSIAVARAAFQSMGHALDVTFFPWSRTIITARTSDVFVGYLPEYDLESDQFLLSPAIGSSTVGFAERRNNPVHWESLDDLSHLTIGVVQDYTNTPELDARIRTGDISVSLAITDSQNLLKLAAGRVDLVVIDPYVLDYLRANDPMVMAVSDQLQWNAKPLGTQTLHVAFTNTSKGRAWLAIFKEGLERIDIDGIVADYVSSLPKPSSQPSR